MTNRYATSWREAIRDPSGVRGRTRSWLRAMALSAAAQWTGKTDARFLRGLYCHYVFDDQVEAFDALIARLKREGSFVDTPTMMAMLRGDRPIDGPYFHLSFDDGFRNCYTNAWPVLRKHEVPALMFVPTGLIGGDYESTRRFCLETSGYGAVIELMNWDEVAELAENGIEIGAHTRTHARFSDMSHDPIRMDDEILGSRTDLEERLSSPCRWISWPFGSLADADEVSLQKVRDYGFEGCFGAYRGSIHAEATDPFSIPRHHFEVQWPESHTLYFARGNREQR